MTLQQLESYLWGAAVLLRGQIDASGYKEYIFPLMFFKRVSDVYDEQYNRYLEESDGDEDYARSQEYDIIVPEGAAFTQQLAPDCRCSRLCSICRSILRI